MDELEERLEAAYAARTYGDLLPLTADLPSVAVMSSVERRTFSQSRDKVPPEIGPDSPRLRVRGLALMGSVTVRRRRVEDRTLGQRIRDQLEGDGSSA